MTKAFRRGAVVTAVVLFALLVFIWFEPGGPDVSHVFRMLAAVGAAAFAAWACAHGSANQAAGARRGWVLLSGAGVGWAANAALIAASDLVFEKRLGAPSIADIPATAAGLLALLAVLAFLKPTVTSAARMRVLLDGFMLAAALSFIAWSWQLRDIYDRAGDVPGRVVSLAYPFIDVVVLALLVVALTRAPKESRKPWTLLTFGLVLAMLGDGTLAFLQFADLRLSGVTLASGRVVGWMLVGLAALAPGAETTNTETRAPKLRDVFVPLVPAVAAAVFSAMNWRSGRLDVFLSVNAAVLVVLLLARQVLAQLEHHDLTKTLESKVVERTDELRRREEQFRSLVAHSSDVVTVVDGSGSITYQSLSVMRLLGYGHNQLIGLGIDRFIHEEDRTRLLTVIHPQSIAAGDSVTVELRLVRADGTWARTETTISNLLQNPAVQGMVLTSRDIGDRKELEDQLRHRAFHDTLTGLGNRALFRDRLEHAVTRVRRYGGDLGVLFVDLDGFKTVNDTLGHDAGDRLLKEVSDRLQECVRTSDTVARMGGDEFAVLLEQAGDAKAAQLVASRILAALQLPIELEGGVQTRAGCSIGIATTRPGDVPSAESLLRDADLAMYRAKAQGKGRAEQFEEGLREAALRRVTIEQELRRAINEGELVLHYQPVVALPSGRISGCEALVRWNHPERGLVPPGEFIPIAEESDLVVELGRWALFQACKDIKALQELTPHAADMWVSVNVATRQLLRPGLLQSTRAALTNSGLDPKHLVLEITEGALLNDPKASAAALTELKSLGVSIAIDDFGTGYSSLSRLRSFPVDKLKIDRSFISEIRSPTDEAPIVAAVMAMAHGLGLTAVAEGVETLAQLACLHAYQCEEVQGFLLARPMAADALTEIVSSPGGLLDATEDALGASNRSSDLGGIVAEASRADAIFEEVARPLLAELAARAALEATWLTSFDDEGVQHVLFACSAGEIGDLERQTLPPERRSGPVVAVGRQVPDVLSSRGIQSMVSVPVLDHNGNVVGRLGAGGTGTEPLAANAVVLMELFTRVVAEGASFAGRAAAAPADTPVSA